MSKTLVDEKFHRFEVELPARGLYGQITMDGRKLEGVTDVQIESGVESVTKITLTLLAHVNVKDPQAKPDDPR